MAKRKGISSSSTLTLDKGNLNKGTERGAELIEKSIERLGYGAPLLLDRNDVVIAGNQRLKVLRKLGRDDIQIIESDGTKALAIRLTNHDLATNPLTRELSLADNVIQEQSFELDAAAFAALNADVDVTWMMTPDQIADILAQNSPVELLTDEDDVPEPPKVPKAKRGQVWICGGHRVMCGDSTSAEDVARLMDGQKADCMWTDPPYGVSYVGKTKNALKIQNDGSDGLRALLDSALGCASSALKAGAPVYVAHPAGAMNVTFGNAFLGAGWRLHQTLIWDKGTIVLGHSDYHFSHEPIFYGYTRGEGRFGRGGAGWYGDDSQRSILEFPKPPRSESHPTMKPVALIEHCLGNSSAPKQLVLDLFGGSGSTLIACEKIGRRCCTMELDPIYVTVILDRYEAATGKKAVLDGITKGKASKIIGNREKAKAATKADQPKIARESKSISARG